MRVLEYRTLRVKNSGEIVKAHVCRFEDGTVKVFIDNNWYPMSAFELT